MRNVAGLLCAALCLTLAPQALAQAKGQAPKAAQKAPQKPGKPAPKAPQKPAPKGKAGKGGAQGGARSGPDEAVRRGIAGGPTADDVQKPVESPELRALREAEKEIFAPAAPRPGSPWPSDAVYPLPIDPDRPVVHASGLPPAQNPREPVEAAVGKDRDLGWIQQLKLPDMPVRWDERVVRYLQFFRDDPRGRATVAYGWKRSGRYREVIRAALRQEKLPESLLWVSMVESGFDPGIRSGAGAAGLWQFMPDGARIYGLRVDRWVDERLDPVMASQAAAKYLSDLHRRFGGWELALAAYNMGYGGLLSAVRKYNTNDFWELSRFEAGIPWETTLYVPKIIALAVVAENPQVFGLTGLDPEPALAFEVVPAGNSLPLDAVARATGASLAELEALNPQLRAKRTPPEGAVDTATVTQAGYAVRVPVGRAQGAEGKLASAAAAEPRLSRYTVRFGQTVEAIAQELGTHRSKLFELNGLTRDDYPKAGEILLVPDGARPSPGRPAERPVVVVPRQPQSIPGKQRVFYRVIPGDSLGMVAQAFSVTADELRVWNGIDPSARLQEGTSLQVFVDESADLSRVVALREGDAQVLTVGTDEFFAYFEAQKGRRRVSVTVGPSDSWKSISGKYSCSVGLLERINRRSRYEPLRPGETLLVYTAKAGGEAPAHEDDAPGLPSIAPHPEDLPPVPEVPGQASTPTAQTDAKGGA